MELHRRARWQCGKSSGAKDRQVARPANANKAVALWLEAGRGSPAGASSKRVPRHERALQTRRQKTRWTTTIPKRWRVRRRAASGGRGYPCESRPRRQEERVQAQSNTEDAPQCAASPNANARSSARWRDTKNAGKGRLSTGSSDRGRSEAKASSSSQDSRYSNHP